MTGASKTSSACDGRVPFAVYDRLSMAWGQVNRGDVSNGGPPLGTLCWPAAGIVQWGKVCALINETARCFGSGLSPVRVGQPVLLPTPIASNSHGCRPVRESSERRRANLNDVAVSRFECP